MSTKKIPPRERPHYVNNKDFTNAVIEYCTVVQKCRKEDNPEPMVPNYLAESILKINERLSHKSNFVRYTYREEMVMDGVENCLKALANFDPTAATRGGTPNAFGYFTQISWFAFLRRIQKKRSSRRSNFDISQRVDYTSLWSTPTKIPKLLRSYKTL